MASQRIFVPPSQLSFSSLDIVETAGGLVKSQDIVKVEILFVGQVFESRTISIDFVQLQFCPSAVLSAKYFVEDECEDNNDAVAWTLRISCVISSFGP